MKPLAKKATPAAIAVLKQATAFWPKRKKIADGLLPSATHQKQNPNSDHNLGLAVDLTHDPNGGVDCHQLFEKLKEDQRVSYLIFDKKIWSKDRSDEGNRDYDGINPHTKHLHISINEKFKDDTSPWFWWMNQPRIVNQFFAAVQPQPKKKVGKQLVCTCCKIHNKK